MKNSFNREIIQVSFLIVATNVAEAVEYLRGRNKRISVRAKRKTDNEGSEHFHVLNHYRTLLSCFPTPRVHFVAFTIDFSDLGATGPQLALIYRTKGGHYEKRDASKAKVRE